MAIVRRVYGAIGSCIFWKSYNQHDDTENIINDRVPPINPTDGGVISSDVPCKSSLEYEILKKTVKKLEEDMEKLKEENRKLKGKNDKIEKELADAHARCDKMQSQIISMQQAKIYEDLELWRRHDVTYSSTYRTEEQERLSSEFVVAT